MRAAEPKMKEIVAALADLSPQPSLERGAKRQIPLEWFRWMPLRSVELFGGNPSLPSNFAGGSAASARGEVPAALLVGQPTLPPSTALDRVFADRLAAVDQVRGGSGSIRLGWMFVAGTMDGPSRRPVQVFEPLLTRRVRVQRSIGQASVIGAGDVELNGAIDDPDGSISSALEGVLGGAYELGLAGDGASKLLGLMPRLHAAVRQAARAGGLEIGELVVPVGSPDAAMKRDGLVAVAGVGLYVDTPTVRSTRASTLRRWLDDPAIETTALAHLYLERPDQGRRGYVPAGRGSGGEADGIESPFPLTPRQREAVAAASAGPITLVSGAPGTGKSHAVAAMAIDEVQRGRSVLVATRTDATVDALVDLLDRMPGPDPVVFGSNERRDALVQRLTSGQMRAASDSDIAAARRSLGRSRDQWAELRHRIRAHLEIEQPADEHGSPVALGLIDRVAEADGAALADLLAAAAEPGGWWTGRRRRRAWDALVEHLGVGVGDVTIDEVRRAVHLAAERRLDQLRSPEIIETERDWARLAQAEDAVRRACGRLVDLESRSTVRLDRKGLVSIANLGTALRSGRSARREQLARLTKTEITRALPLWIGTLGDIDDLLPPRAALFDVVILDEASSIDQPLAAPALLRASRAVVVGDPKQLRHVSFVSDERIRGVLATHGIDADPQLAGLLDVRRNSLFDVAAGSVPVIELDEQFRSDPHLVDFISRRLYGGVMQVATRNPRTESVDRIDVVRLDGARDDDGVVEAEVDAVMGRLRALRGEGARSVGVVTPFRAQADAIEREVLDAFHADDVEALDLRIGTVHAMQGNERDLVIASMGIGPQDRSSWRFVEDPHLFTVLVTRARKHFEILLSAEPPPGGLVADYLAQADEPPRLPPPTMPGRSDRPDRSDRPGLDRWVETVARGVELTGVRVTAPYPAGRHRVDLCVGDDIDFVGVEARVHPDGVDAHIDRHLALRRAGWRLVEAFEGRWEGRVGELSIELANSVQARRS